LPSCIGPGHQTAAAKRTPSNRVLPKNPSVTCHAPVASHWPVVGSALNWQGQPQLQLQLTTSSPAIRHLIFVGSLIFPLLYFARPPNRGSNDSRSVFEDDTITPRSCILQD
jgi:hypothetical protein